VTHTFSLAHYAGKGTLEISRKFSTGGAGGRGQGADDNTRTEWELRQEWNGDRAQSAHDAVPFD
jgi:hypothetical protein